MTDKQPEIIKNTFDELWDDYKSGYDDLIAKINDDSYVVRSMKTISQINRAIISNRYVMNTYDKDCHIIDAACGNGFNTVHMAKLGYNINGFDVSDSAILDAKRLADEEGVNTDIFSTSDHSFFKSVESGSVDCVMALGLMRYLSPEDNNEIYSEVGRILKPGGCMLVSNDNALFEIFALNNGTLDFWENLISGYSDAGSLFGERSLRDVMDENYKLPQRVYAPTSASQKIKPLSRNPLTFADDVAQYELSLEKNYFPDTHILPPLLESIVDQEALDTIKAKVALERSEDDWRAMFMCFEFLSCLKRNDDS